MNTIYYELEEKEGKKLMDEISCAYGEELIEINKRLLNDPSAAVPEDVHARCLAFINSQFPD